MLVYHQWIKKGDVQKRLFFLMTSQTVKNGGFYITNIMDLNGCPFFSFIILRKNMGSCREIHSKEGDAPFL